MREENPRASIKEIANQVLTEWESFTWDQKERLIEYVKIQEGGGDEKEEEEDEEVPIERADGDGTNEGEGII